MYNEHSKSQKGNNCAKLCLCVTCRFEMGNSIVNILSKFAENIVFQTLTFTKLLTTDADTIIMRKAPIFFFQNWSYKRKTD